MQIKITIDGKEIITDSNKSILDIASENGINIPNMCYDPLVEAYGGCGLCAVEAEGVPKLLRACATKPSDGMVIHTDSDRVKQSRKVALELLLTDHTGDCKAPCTKACPAGTDCQGYVGLIANGEYEEAVKLIREKVPFPSSIGRVCPHPCEKACRRQYVDSSISIAFLKSFAADKFIGDTSLLPEKAENSGKSVAVIGGGPAGLTAAYFLALKGHNVTVFEQMPKMGGMLRYGIPEYRLPKQVLDKEIEFIKSAGITFKNNVNIGKDILFENIKNDYDAVVLAAGAWKSSKMRVPGEELDGVFGGIDFLREVSLGKKPEIGKNVAVCGGGNTAMDACRTAVRLGAENVYVIYRRTKDEMPADPQEILESEEEGVIYKYLTNPIEFTESNGHVSGIVLQKMKLGEPDESGRRRPEPIDGETETIALDSVIMAIGQAPNLSGFEALEQTRKGTVAASESNFTTSEDGVFAIGDVSNKGADIAIAAIGEAEKAAKIIDAYLHGEKLIYRKPFLVERDDSEIDYSCIEKAARAVMPQLSPVERKKSFVEVNKGFTDEQAINEAKRCLECGCHDYYECKLVKYADENDVSYKRLCGEKHSRNTEDRSELISRNADKCVLCGLCVRICDKVVGKSAIGLVDRGFGTSVITEFGKKLAETDCTFCGMCVDKCPTGALREKSGAEKALVVKEKSKITVCELCEKRCPIDVRFIGETITRIKPYGKDTVLCKKGKFDLLSDKTLLKK